MYFAYGSSFMLNVTSEAVQSPGGGVLLACPRTPPRELTRCSAPAAGAGLLDLARGPGRLTEAMQVNLKQDGLDLCAAGPLWLATSRRPAGVIGKSVRIGLTRSVDSKLRFYERGSLYVSGPKRDANSSAAQA